MNGLGKISRFGFVLLTLILFAFALDYKRAIDTGVSRNYCRYSQSFPACHDTVLLKDDSAKFYANIMPDLFIIIGCFLGDLGALYVIFISEPKRLQNRSIQKDYTPPNLTIEDIMGKRPPKSS